MSRLLALPVGALLALVTSCDGAEPGPGGGDDDDVDQTGPGSWTAVAAGGRHSCGIDDTGAVWCWGADDRGQCQVPGGTGYVAIATGADHSCALASDGKVDCWGDGSAGQIQPEPGEYATIDAGWDHTCGVTTDGQVRCWGDDGQGQSDTGGQPTGFASVSAGETHTCGLLVGGAIACWGDNSAGESAPFIDNAATISAGSHTTWALMGTGQPAWWGHEYATLPPEVPLAALDAGAHFGCAIEQAEGHLACFGDEDDHGELSPPTGQYVHVSVGVGHACALSQGGNVACWGDGGDGQLDVP